MQRLHGLYLMTHPSWKINNIDHLSYPIDYYDLEDLRDEYESLLDENIQIIKFTNYAKDISFFLLRFSYPS